MALNLPLPSFFQPEVVAALDKIDGAALAEGVRRDLEMRLRMADEAKRLDPSIKPADLRALGW